MNLTLLRGEEGALERTLRKKESFEARGPKNPSGNFDKIPEDHKKKTGDRRYRKILEKDLKAFSTRLEKTIGIKRRP